MIRSTNVSLKYANKCKTDKISWFVSEYVKVVDSFIDILWSIEKVPQLLPKKYTSQIKTPLMSWAIQCAGKQASGIVRGTRKKLEQRQYIVNKLINEGNIKKARKLQRIIDESSVSKPTLDHINPELDSRFVTIDLENSTSFDGWLSLQGILPKEKIKIPFKKNKHFNKLLESGKIKSGIRLSKTKITFMFDLPDVDKKEHGETIGIDIGQTTVISCSNGHLSTQNNHGYDLAKISDILARKKKDSKAFLKAQKHRTNYINWAINQINLDSINVVKLENIKNIRKNKKFSRRLSHWTYTEIFSKLESKCEENGVQIQRISPTYTSKRCSNCGWTRASNRKGKLFKCGQCSFTIDADLNASKNIGANIKPIGYNKRQIHNIKTGFWWKEPGDELIVHPVKEMLIHDFS